jgi:heme A synthase
VRDFNAENLQHEELWTRILHAGDAVRHALEDARAAEARKKDARLAYLAILAENPERRGPRSRQLAIAGVTLALDAVACDFAAQALGNGQLETLAWTTLFLAVLACGELALDYYRDRRRKLWRVFAVGLAGFVAGLGVLRYSYLITVGTGELLAALVGAVLFTVATAMFVLAGYWALRRAETPRAGRARREARRAAKESAASKDRSARLRRQRDKLIDAYLVRIKAGPLQGFPAGQLPQVEAALRAHLLGQESS